ncbi:hypothetical protein HY573_02170 [Candidatus Parcubacteria bacterium]|nr:hypothetical protein [Candidatus Parcubacteria bacterium]MBI4385611.1 hypothetical protein [Candidatus Parcubacteria bacterium]
MSKLRRDEAVSQYRSVECRYCHKAARVLNGSKLGYRDAQWQCRHCGCWNSFSADPDELRREGRAGSFKLAAPFAFAWE